MIMRLLAHKPVIASTNVEMWQRMYRVTLAQFAYYWNETDIAEKGIEWSKVEYAEWSEFIGGTHTRFYGTRDPVTKKAKGVVRSEDPFKL